MKSVTTLIAALGLAPVVLVAQKTSFDYDKTADFTQYKTYALKDGTKVGEPLIDNRITAAIESELAAKGMTKNERQPDVDVVYHVAFDKQQDITAYSTAAAATAPTGIAGAAAGATTTDVRVNEILVGTLVIDVADANKASRLARHGRQGSRRPGQGRKARQEHQSAVKKILKNFPPPVKK